MSQVTIYLEAHTLALAKDAAARSKLSLSKWFAQLAERERQAAPQSWAQAMQDINALRDEASDDAIEFLSEPRAKQSELGTDAARVGWT